MKPPSRPRSAPARYSLGPTARVWTEQEKRRLLQALRAQVHTPGPLRPELLKKYLPSRDETEIMGFVDLLKERVAKEAVKAQYQHRRCKQKDAPLPAPIEVWITLAEKLTGRLGDAVTAAFSQVLTIASAEPLCLLHSVPPRSKEIKNVQRSSLPTVHNENRKSNEQCQEVTISSNAEEQTPTENSGFHVDFERIYKYLSVISRGSKAPELPPGESAVLLDLLLSLPEELGCLDFKKLKTHMYKCYIDLTTNCTGERSRANAEATQPVNKNENLNSFHVFPDPSSLPQQQQGSSPASSKDDTAPAFTMDWKTLGICPLNSFLLPLDILARKSKCLN
ncbi:snRNA-activating protein complex subunit 2 [Varanus komodoensis]|uniref:snRNA-activating protein complex subunit 2 n=1 Tax=Varanus komodoensis TaxID=61221 RepID=A0A8D2KSL7_VARKO|nr:snRNA-activating protein complex subunit 2 [Varanus komodoensis]KAF7253549.1 snRNA-activating protein complex subunit 2 [Varanus komodoensis]